MSKQVYRPKTHTEIEDVLCTKKSDTGLALLCVIDNEEVWIPVSQINLEESEVTDEGDDGTLVVSEWFARKLGVI